MSYSVQCKYTTDIEYYKTMKQWLLDTGMTAWRWDDGRYRMIFEDEMDALTFKLRYQNDVDEQNI